MWRGVNLSGMNYAPGQQWPRDEAIGYYLRDCRMDVVRYNLAWELLQPAPGGPLDPAVVAGVRRHIAMVAGLGGRTVIDLHSFGRRQVGDRHLVVGEAAALPVRQFADLWAMLARAFPEPSTIYNLMNEPHDQNDAVLAQATNAALAAIRGTGARNLVLVSGNGYSNRVGWRRGSGNDALMSKVSDPADHWAIDYHCYLDPWSAGQTGKIDPGWVADVEPFIDWCGRTRRRAFMGEFATAADPASLAALASLLTRVEARPDVWLGWTWWGAGGWLQADYPYRLDPYPTRWPNADKKYDEALRRRADTWAPPLVDRPQMGVLKHWLPRG